MISRTSILGLLMFTSLAACAPATVDQARSAVVNVKAVQIVGRPLRCLPTNDLNVSIPQTELKGSMRTRMLTPMADQAKVRIWVSGSAATDFGSMNVLYTNEDYSCVLWAETITLQEYAQRQGLTPLNLSPFYEPDKAKASVVPPKAS